MYTPRIKNGRAGKRRGSFVVMFALMNTVLFSFTALAVDVSYVRSVFGQMQRSVDAAAHATMVAYSHGASSSAALAQAQALAQANPAAGQPVVISSSNVTYGYYDFSAGTFGTAANSNAVKFQYSAPINLLFGSLISNNGSTGKVVSTVAMRPREIVLLVDISSGSQAPKLASAYQNMLAEIEKYQFSEDKISLLMYNGSVIGGGSAQLNGVVADYTMLDNKWSKLDMCSGAYMPPCEAASDPGNAVNTAVALLQAQGNNRYSQSIYLITGGDIRCSTGLSSCASGLKNQVVSAVDAAWAAGISVNVIGVQSTPGDGAFLETLLRGNGIRTGYHETTTVADIDYFLESAANHIPLAIVE